MPRKVPSAMLINEKAPNYQTIYLYQQIIHSKECRYRYILIFDLYYTAQENVMYANMHICTLLCITESIFRNDSTCLLHLVIGILM